VVELKMSNLTKFVMALIGLLAMAIVVSRQLFLFAALRSPMGSLDSPAGLTHLWLSLGAAIAACISGILMFHFFGRHEKQKWSKVGMPPPATLLTPSTINRASSQALTPFDAKRWALANSWLVKQPDDEIPMDGSVRDIGGTPSEQRAFARRTHQLMFKKWSQDRHD
jgi:hypothetical protein